MQIRIKPAIPFLFLFLIITSITSCNRKQESTTTLAPPIVPAPTTEMTMTYISTFKFARPERIVLEYYNKMSDQRDSIAAQTKKEITDSASVDEFMSMTAQLADKGDIMIKMGDVPILNVILFYPNEKLYFTFYQNRVKTPDTSFFANAPENEKKLHEFLFSLLNK